MIPRGLLVPRSRGIPGLDENGPLGALLYRNVDEGNPGVDMRLQRWVSKAGDTCGLGRGRGEEIFQHHLLELLVSRMGLEASG